MRFAALNKRSTAFLRHLDEHPTLFYSRVVRIVQCYWVVFVHVCLFDAYNTRHCLHELIMS